MNLALNNALKIFASGDYQRLIRAVGRRIYVPKAKNYRLYKHFVKGKKCLEVGGPSDRIFGRHRCLPLYSVLGSLDNCNFGQQDIWNGELRGGMTFRYGGRPGYQYIVDTTELKGIPDKSYDVVLSCHCLEHVANPLKAMSEWLRIAKEGLILVVPDKAKTFDHRRPLTTLEHLISDFEHDTKEDDLTHLEEILLLHDYQKDYGGTSPEQLRSRGNENFIYRSLHHHTFSLESVIELSRYFDLQTLAAETVPPDNIVGAFAIP